MLPTIRNDINMEEFSLDMRHKSLMEHFVLVYEWTQVGLVLNIAPCGLFSRIGESYIAVCLP